MYEKVSNVFMFNEIEKYINVKITTKALQRIFRQKKKKINKIIKNNLHYIHRHFFIHLS
jgi:hypothetical protein